MLFVLNIFLLKYAVNVIGCHINIENKNIFSINILELNH